MCNAHHIKIYTFKHSKTPGEHGPQNQLRRAHRGLQRWGSGSLKQHLSLHESELGPLLITLWLIALSFCGSPNSGSGLFLTLLPLLGTPFSYWVDIRVYAKSYCIFMVFSVEITGKPTFF